MRWKEGEYWLRDAVKYVKFPPDRRKVQQELYEHMIARNRDFLNEGCSEEEADRRVCEAMGDPEEVGKALAEVHKPFWGYFLRVLRILLVLVVLLSAASVVRGGGEILNYYYLRALNGEINERVSTWIPQHASAIVGDYRFRLAKAGLTGPEPSADMRYFLEKGIYLVLQLRTFTWDPNLGPPQFVYRTLTVEDSGGKEYTAFTRGELDLIFAGGVTILVKDFDPTAEWAVLHFDSGEQSFQMPVHLKGAGK